MTDAITPYVLLAGTLGELHAKLPPGLVRSDHQPADPGVVVEVLVSVGGIGLRLCDFRRPTAELCRQWSLVMLTTLSIIASAACLASSAASSVSKDI